MATKFIFVCFLFACLFVCLFVFFIQLAALSLSSNNSVKRIWIINNS